MAASDRAEVWVLTGPHKGDNNQVLALAEGLGLPFRTIELHFGSNSYWPALRRAASISGLTEDSRREIAPPWPSLVLGIGQRSAPVARFIKQQSGGRTKVVRLGDPMVPPRLFDLVITTTQYAVREADNVVRLPITITSTDAANPDRFEERWFEGFARPRRLLVIGGKTSLWRFDPSLITKTIATLKAHAEREGGSIFAVTSPRTSPELLAAAQRGLGDRTIVTGPFPRYGALLSAADEIHVTGDSVSMLSDAVASGRPVGLIPLEPDRIAGLVGLIGLVRGKPLRLRDLRKFWDDLRTRGLVGTIEEPRSGNLEVSPMETAIAAVHAVLEGQLPERAPPPRLATALPKISKSAAPARG
jgi:mitochondrial fission protein ELM1